MFNRELAFRIMHLQSATLHQLKKDELMTLFESFDLSLDGTSNMSKSSLIHTLFERLEERLNSEICVNRSGCAIPTNIDGLWLSDIDPLTGLVSDGVELVDNNAIYSYLMHTDAFKRLAKMVVNKIACSMRKKKDGTWVPAYNGVEACWGIIRSNWTDAILADIESAIAEYMWKHNGCFHIVDGNVAFFNSASFLGLWHTLYAELKKYKSVTAKDAYKDYVSLYDETQQETLERVTARNYLSLSKITSPEQVIATEWFSQFSRFVRDNRDDWKGLLLVLIHRANGETYTQIATAMGISERTVARRLGYLKILYLAFDKQVHSPIYVGDNDSQIGCTYYPDFSAYQGICNILPYEVSRMHEYKPDMFEPHKIIALHIDWKTGKQTERIYKIVNMVSFGVSNSSPIFRKSYWTVSDTGHLTHHEYLEQDGRKINLK